ncbi:MAG: hypothetical protein LBG87_09780 [Spirochaetaceae bacterium]|jgi:hypothetical protein|nr:hypothetical protein [Spirochaetaceae bacterium]
MSNKTYPAKKNRACAVGARAYSALDALRPAPCALRPAPCALRPAPCALLNYVGAILFVKYLTPEFSSILKIFSKYFFAGISRYAGRFSGHSGWKAWRQTSIDGLDVIAGKACLRGYYTGKRDGRRPEYYSKEVMI